MSFFYDHLVAIIVLIGLAIIFFMMYVISIDVLFSQTTYSEDVIRELQKQEINKVTCDKLENLQNKVNTARFASYKTSKIIDDMLVKCYMIEEFPESGGLK